MVDEQLENWQDIYKIEYGKHIILSNDKPFRINKKQDITGNEYHGLTAIKYCGLETQKDGTRRSVWKFRCKCGNHIYRIANVVKRLEVKSCGCSSHGFMAFNRNDYGESSYNQLYRRYKVNALNKCRVFDVSNEEFRKITKEDCYYCGSKPMKIMKATKVCYGEYIYNGIDRIDSNKGYIKDNIVPCCGICNYAKSNTTQEDFLKWVKKVYSHIYGNNL
jgi:hypothetical protein